MRLIQPRAPQYEDVGKAIVVVVGVDEIQSADDPFQPGLERHVLEGAIAVVPKIAELIPQSPRRRHDVEIAVGIKILHHTAARQTDGIEAECRRDVHEPPEPGA